jgi:hypothetical protein
MLYPVKTMKSTASAIVIVVSCLLARNGASQPSIASLSVTSQKANGHISLTFTLTNRSTAPLWINRRLAVEEESCRQQVGEIRIRVVDARGRIVPFACSQRALPAQATDYGILLPSEKATSTFNDFDECYFVEEGEKLTVSAFYLDAVSTPPPPRTGSLPLRTRIDADPVHVRVPRRGRPMNPIGPQQ